VIRRALVAASLSLLATPAARGNGRFPRAQEFHQAPAPNDDLMVVRATFGMVVSVDRGRRWEYWCEDALEYGDGYDPAITYAADGSMLVALEDGLAVTRDGCTRRRSPDLESLSVRDLASSPDGRVTYAIALTRDALPDSRVARTRDNGLTFEFLGERLSGVALETIEVAGSDPMRLYASGTLVADRTPVLYRSVDGGAHWGRTAARFGGATGVYVSGVDGRRPEVLYLRATAASEDMDGGSAEGAGVLFESDDGGDTVRVVLRTRGPMRGFAISDDGRSVWAGGPEDGVWRSVDGAAPARLSDEPVDCLRWSSGSLWACPAFTRGGPLLLRSDGAAPFVTAMSVTDINGPPARCAAGTVAREVCPGRWSVVQRALLPAPSLDASTDLGVTPPPPASPGGCACGVGPRSRAVCASPWCLAFALALAAGRRRGAP
jgi:hypothetical protein